MYKNILARFALSGFGLMVMFTTIAVAVVEGPYIGAHEEGAIVGTTIWLAALGTFVPIGFMFFWRGLTRRY